MPMFNLRPPRGDPPEGGVRLTRVEVLNVTVELAGGAQGAVGASRLGRGQLPAVARA